MTGLDDVADEPGPADDEMAGARSLDPEGTRSEVAGSGGTDASGVADPFDGGGSEVGPER